ncbi:hypothetical protein GCM10007857_46200 [Bradyrhizobium iriomotense]|uniref:Membrane transporter protein n=1 Tax=Bradyrhizobium iriomotense TaxID=441950 RepID=A0ABQ6B6T8_9BRAD|nr:hypothetical protein [Bradyrhizobium iriomotense]GLR87908.1 hypothetical protein GCM10007857_46200 [Bradyrhizobium iriomotense]
MELTAPTFLIAFAGAFLIGFMKGAFGGGFAIIGIPIVEASDLGLPFAQNRTFGCSRVNSWPV